MKRIVFFCDGTWNRLDAGRPTHAVRLAQAVTPSAVDGRTQVVFYQQGVGTGRGSNMVARLTDRFLGGAFGWGLDDNIIDAYRHLVFCYEPGDEIFIFGFSRGAYTARSLAGLIRSAGIPPRDRIARINEAIAQYRARGPDTHPDSKASKRFRADFAPITATSQQDFDWRLAQGMDDTRLLTLAYLGVWDTVGALGLPSFLGVLAKLINHKYTFHDAALSRSVRSARHAVAIDERRRLYPPTLWDNLDTLNDGATDPEPPYRQLWFPGNHGIVGGSGTVPQLSAGTADWIAEGARMAGLEFDRVLLRQLVGPADSAAPLPDTLKKAGLFSLGGLLLRDRSGPARPSEVSINAADRVRAVSGYRPASLSRVLAAILAK
ncbi:DUF2235 domain-containing protein [Thalassovita taeanensis]|uniref:Uncharacterized protein, PA2063/DUF2235 family n=1 Tax=Thalassovita taeanensis TaxID=657014 RepID=A0A1H9HUG4_9RHOB|nr:DUF2235 domain-containing protein [Thalassovita taeanensis]SEQ65974.1 Uncharacterized protein, PA2063/DUF2235 family [Thalassovita taeanensis]